MTHQELFTLIASQSGVNHDAINQALNSFREATLDKFIATQHVGGNVREVEVEVTDAMLRRLFERIQGQWVAVGDSEPYVSVLADDKYSMNNISANLAEFRASGAMGIRLLQQLALKNGVDVNYRHCVELGSGVGRLTAHLAPHFQSMLGVDISPGNLRVAQAYLDELKLSHAKLQLLTQLPELEKLATFDAFVSFIAIQHNPPPIQNYILDTVLGKLNPGGVFMFQTIVNAPNYRYTAESNFLYKEGPEYEMHCLPTQHVLRLISKHGLTLLDVVKDRHGGAGIDSFTFFGVKPAA